MLIDLHTHENFASSDSLMSLQEAVAAAQAAGLDALCITDHNSMEIGQVAADWLSRAKLPVFIGVEYTTCEGDMLAFGLPDLSALPARRLSAQDFIDLVLAAGGFCCAAHPFRSAWGDPDQHYLRRVQGLQGIEVYNGGNDPQENLLAGLFCMEHGFIPVAGSDAHRVKDVGSYATWFPERITSIPELVAALKAGKGRPAMRLTDGSYVFVPDKQPVPASSI
jgi:predicted metal-dependent phosphoesterase TrpH